MEETLSPGADERRRMALVKEGIEVLLERSDEGQVLAV